MCPGDTVRTAISSQALHLWLPAMQGMGDGGAISSQALHLCMPAVQGMGGGGGHLRSRGRRLAAIRLHRLEVEAGQVVDSRGALGGDDDVQDLRPLSRADTRKAKVGVSQPATTSVWLLHSTSSSPKKALPTLRYAMMSASGTDSAIFMVMSSASCQAQIHNMNFTLVHLRPEENISLSACLLTGLPIWQRMVGPHCLFSLSLCSENA